jgi:DNA transformation protein
MSVSQGFLEFVLEQLEGAGRVTHKKFFGGAGLYAGGPIFGLIDSDDRFYLKVDDETRGAYEARGSFAFNPYGEESGKKAMNYMSVPDDVLEDPEELTIWARQAMAVADRGKG